MAESTPLISWTERGLYCDAGDFHIDPSRGVKTAVITHAHSDHARRGSQRYFCAKSGLGLLKARLGSSIQAQGVPYGESFELGGVRISFHPAGHILGSAQVRVEKEGEVWVASGDYKRDPDPSCEPFEALRCDTFISEATFGTPRYVWEKGRDPGKEIHAWWMQNAEAGENSVLFGYSLGKAQRILAELCGHAQRPVLVDSTIARMTCCYREEGRSLASTLVIDEIGEAALLRGELLLIPPSSSLLESGLGRRLGAYRSAFASGWMQAGAKRFSTSYDRGFVLSDHADWNDLLRTIAETGASRVFVQHRNGALIRELRARGVEASPVSSLAPGSFARLKPVNLSFSRQW